MKWLLLSSIQILLIFIFFYFACLFVLLSIVCRFVLSCEWCFNILLCTFRWKSSSGSWCFGNTVEIRNYFVENWCLYVMFVYVYFFCVWRFCCFPFGCARTYFNWITAPFMLRTTSKKKKKNVTYLTHIYISSMRKMRLLFWHLVTTEAAIQKGWTIGGSKGHFVHMRIERKKRFGSNWKLSNTYSIE